MKVNWPWARPKDNYLVLAGFILASELSGIIGAVFTVSAIPTWYMYLTKPTFSPPNWLFGPVWTLLYALMGAAAYMVWRQYRFGKKSYAFWFNFVVQLILNFLWTPLFFGLHWVAVAMTEILVMWYFIFQTIRIACRLEVRAAYLLVPYLAWVTFASLLNLAILMLN